MPGVCVTILFSFLIWNNWNMMLYFKCKRIELKWNHSEMSCCILHVVTSSWVFPSLTDSVLTLKGEQFLLFQCVCLRKSQLVTHTSSWNPALSSSSFAFKGPGTKQFVFANPQKVNFKMLYKNICGVFVLKLHTHIRGTSEIYFISCENGILPAI